MIHTNRPLERDIGDIPLNFDQIARDLEERSVRIKFLAGLFVHGANVQLLEDGTVDARKVPAENLVQPPLAK